MHSHKQHFNLQICVFYIYVHLNNDAFSVIFNVFLTHNTDCFIVYLK